MHINDKGILPQQQGELARAKQIGRLSHFVVAQVSLDTSLDVADICSLIAAEVESTDAFLYAVHRTTEKWQLQRVRQASDCVLIQSSQAQVTATKGEHCNSVAAVKSFLSNEDCSHGAVIDVQLIGEGWIKITAVFAPWLTDPKGLDIFLCKVQAAINNRHLASQVAVELSNNAVSFDEYVRWQHDILELEEAQIGQQFWKMQLRKGRNAQSIPWHNNLPEKTPSIGEVQEYIQILPQSLLVSINAYVSKNRVSHVALFLSCWALLQARICVESNFLTYVRVDGREDDDLKGFISPCDPVVPVAININEKAPFIQNIKDIEDALTEACEWRECFDFSDVRGIPSLFNHSSPLLDRDGKNDDLPAESHGVSDLVVNIVDNRLIRWVGCTCYFGQDALSLLANYMQQLLQQLVSSPIAITASLKLENGVQEVAVVDKQDSSSRIFIPIHQQFFMAAEQFAHLPAIESELTVVTYQQLSQKVFDFAAVLQHYGVSENETVTVCLPNSVELIVAILAVMQVGANFVNVALPMPINRIRKLVNDTGASWYIAEYALDIDAEIKPVLLTELVESQPNWSPVDILASTLAYKIFTSGSTGQPKSVMVDHGAIALQLESFQQWVKLTSNDRIVLRTNCGFDAFVWEALLPLLSGSKLLLNQTTAPADIVGLHALIQERRATVLQVTPSLLRILLRDGGSDMLDGLRVLVVGGEQFTPELHAALSDAKCEVLNVYGPAEACIHTTAHRVGNCRYEGGVPIGRPLQGYKCKIVDHQDKDVAMGMEGQLCVTGRGLFQGYYNDPELTVQSFIPAGNTLQGASGWYRTGDRVRQLPNGTFEFLGRQNRQVKINGYRLDLNEITAAVESCRGVEQAYAVVQRQHEQDVLFVVFQTQPHYDDLDEASIRACLQQELPYYLIPSFIMKIHSIPLNRNGKVDTEEICSFISKANSAEFKAPRTESEKRILVVWQALLKSNAISIHDNFYQVGGHSLLFSRLLIRLNEVFKLDLALVDVLRYTTIAQLAECIDNHTCSQKVLPE